MGVESDAGLPPAELAALAAGLLRGNDRGSMTAASPLLYPHMWSWDAAFVAVGLASLNVGRAVVELDTLLSAQWSTGMIPHIVYADGVDGYFPGPDRWGCPESAAATPRGRRTSGIIQPPVHAIAVQRIVERARAGGRSAQEAVQEFVEHRWTDLMRWHRWLAEVRDPEQCGRITVYHGWESGMDNSPRWDAAYAAVIPGEVPAYRRTDDRIVTGAGQRPSDREYERYLWLIEEMKSVRYDDARLPSVMSFAVQDAFFSAIFAVACEVLAGIGEDYRRSASDIGDLYAWADRFRAGVAGMADQKTGAARDFDLRARSWIATETVAQFAPLLCGGLPQHREEALFQVFDGARWCGHRDLRFALPPSTSPESKDFRPRQYWRGPVWPVINWLFSWVFARRGWPERSLILRTEGLRQAGDGTFAEYYEPFTGEPLGSMQQSWTAAAVLDWLA